MHTGAGRPKAACVEHVHPFSTIRTITVGSGIAPDLLTCLLSLLGANHAALADFGARAPFTAGGDLHPALRTKNPPISDGACTLNAAEARRQAGLDEVGLVEVGLVGGGANRGMQLPLVSQTKIRQFDSVECGFISPSEFNIPIAGIIYCRPIIRSGQDCQPRSGRPVMATRWWEWADAKITRTRQRVP